jgi:Protein of unknown function (DUF2499)
LPNVRARDRGLALGTAALFFASLATCTSLFDGHTPFLAGLGNLPTDFVQGFPWVAHSEPDNALSIPTWLIHFSSVLEYWYAMSLVWQYAEATENPKWKGLTWGMLPLHASGICACTYHFFYNAQPALQFLVTSQAGLTLLGNITCAIAAFRIAVSNGWSIPVALKGFLNQNNPAGLTSPEGIVVDELAERPLAVQPVTSTGMDMAVPMTQSQNDEANVVLLGKLAVATVGLSYLTKYGELGLDIPFEVDPLIAVAMITGIPALTAFKYYQQSVSEGGSFSLPIPSFGGGGDGKPSLSMADVKKYGVAGTVAYVITELAFWVVAFPVAATALYQSTGHWPDVINDTADRTAVLAFIFAGANVARLLVPVRLGAALALAPWVDDNILNRSAAKP